MCFLCRLFHSVDTVKVGLGNHGRVALLSALIVLTVSLLFVCRKQFRSPFEVRQHMRNHTGELPFQCPVCPMRLINQATYRQHMAWHKAKPGMPPAQLALFTVNLDLMPYASQQHSVSLN